ncbi:segregation/condensation protein A [Clostridium sp.]|uniref:segregation/condensation protein A n=1 Tax=Clostridium sp. TaxID=1506 RepID=UPI00346468AE
MQLLNIKIANFEGPFDLLLHLIKKNEMDIYHIKIYDITNQYLDYINEMKELDLNITSEFIVMAATLLEIKSKMLLPKDKSTSEDEEDEDPRKVLMEKLIEYKKFKKAAEYLGIKKGDAGFVFSKKPEIIEDKRTFSNEELFKNISMLDLYILYNELINRYNNKKNTTNVISKEIPIDKYKVEDKIKFLKERLSKIGATRFSDLMMDCECKIEVVVTFLAILELIKEKTIKVVQENNFDKIYIERILELNGD